MNKYLPSALLLSYVVKCGIKAPSLYDALIVASLAIYMGVTNYLESTRIPEIREELAKHKEEQHKELKNIQTLVANQVQSVKDQIVSMNLGAIKKAEPMKFKF